MKDKDAIILENLYSNIKILENANIGGMNLPPGFKDASIIRPFEELNVDKDDEHTEEPSHEESSEKKPEIIKSEEDNKSENADNENDTEEVKESKRYKTLEEAFNDVKAATSKINEPNLGKH